jgi:hypothetical protein
MKKIISIGMVLILAGCGLAVSGGQTTADPVVEGWYNPNKTGQQLSQDLDECRAKCLTA